MITAVPETNLETYGWIDHMNSMRIADITSKNKTQQIDGLVQERRNSSALAVELRISSPTHLNMADAVSDYNYCKWLDN